MSTGDIVIVGSGQAAAVAAHALREHGHAGRIRMVGRERHKPYERPPLSKAMLVAAEEPRMEVLPDATWSRLEVELIGGCEVERLDPGQRRVQLAGGDALSYDRCLLATGGEARVLAGLPPGTRGVHYIRTLDDARRLREALRRRPRLAIVGGGFLGLEVAHSALAAGASVTVLEGAPALLERFLPRAASDWLEASLRSAGAQVLLGAALDKATAMEEGGVVLLTRDGARLEADEVVVAIGLSPNDGLARAAGLGIAPGGGVLVDAACRTTVESIFACGDCTSQLRPGHARPTRMESWQNANEQARTAAAAMLGQPLPAAPSPWFWTDQGSNNLQMLGLPAADLAYLCRGDVAKGKALWVGHRDGVLVHGVALNTGNELRALRPLFERACPVALHDFHHDHLNLRAWAKQSLADATATLSIS